MKRITFIFLTAVLFLSTLATGIFLVKIFPNWNHAHGSLPTCNGHPADVYVEGGTIIGGPNNGNTYTGTLVADTPSIIVGTDGNDSIQGSTGDDVICPGNGSDTINGNGGSDTLTFSTTNAPSGVILSMSGNNAGSFVVDSVLSTFTNIENITGTANNDVFYMDYPITGNLDGGSGIDIADYSQLSHGVTANLFTGIIENVSGTASNIENLTGGAGNNILIGNAGNNTLRGYTAQDIIFGGDGDDTIDGGQGYNLLIGGKGSDSLQASGRANVTLFITDETSYSNSSATDTTTLAEIMTQWSSGSAYAEKVAAIISAYLSTSTLQHDDSADSVTVASNSITNWYILKTSQDILNAAFPGEVITDTSTTSPSSGSSDSHAGSGTGGGGSSANVPVMLSQSLSTTKILTEKNQLFSTKVPDPDQVKNVTLRIFGTTHTLTHTRGSATYKLVITTPTQAGTYPYVLTVNYGSYNIKQNNTILITKKISAELIQNLTNSINDFYQLAYGRQPTPAEWLYWANRIKNGEKLTPTALLGAIQWHAQRQ